MSLAAAIGVIYQIILDFWPAFEMMDSKAAPVARRGAKSFLGFFLLSYVTPRTLVFPRISNPNLKVGWRIRQTRICARSAGGFLIGLGRLVWFNL